MDEVVITTSADQVVAATRQSSVSVNLPRDEATLKTAAFVLAVFTPTENMVIYG